MKGGKTVSRKTLRRIRSLFRLLCLLGLLLIYGTAGASDWGDISLGRALVQSVIGLAAFAVGAWFGGMIQW